MPSCLSRQSDFSALDWLVPKLSPAPCRRAAGPSAQVGCHFQPCCGPGEEVLKNFLLVPLVKKKCWITMPVLVHREMCQHRSEILRIPTLSTKPSRTFEWGDFSETSVTL